MRFLVLPNGRMGECRITGPSGNPDMDRATCRLARQRLRFRPARDAWGRAVAEWMDGEHVWEGRVGPDRWVEPTIPDEGWD